jgi:hypothetical protein
MIEQILVPAEFWGTVSVEEFAEIIKNDGCLDADQCARLWEMANWEDPVPDTVQVMVEREQFEQWLTAIGPKPQPRRRGRVRR